MLEQIVSKMAAGLLLLAALGFQTPAFAARQGAAPQSAAPSKAATAAPTTAKKAVVRPRTVRKRKSRPKAQLAPTPARITEIQSALAAQGTYKAQPNGKWDTATIQAMKDFQASHALTVTGKLDALTLQKLGLGSEIAGRAAPLPLAQTPTAANPAGANPTTAQQQTP